MQCINLCVDTPKVSLIGRAHRLRNMGKEVEVATLTFAATNYKACLHIAFLQQHSIFLLHSLLNMYVANRVKTHLYTYKSQTVFALASLSPYLKYVYAFLSITMLSFVIHQKLLGDCYSVCHGSVLQCILLLFISNYVFPLSCSTV